MVDDSICTEVFHDCNVPGKGKKSIRISIQPIKFISCFDSSVEILVEMIEECFA